MTRPMIALLTSKKYLLSAMLLAAVVWTGCNMGSWMVTKDEARKADAVFLLMGSMGDRSLFAIDLVKKGYADKIYMVNPVDGQRKLLLQKGIRVPADTEIMKNILIQQQIDSTAIHVLQGPATNTLDEAQAFAGLCRRNRQIRQVLVVTSTYHTGRAASIFRRIFKKEGVAVQCSFPENPYSGYQAAKWWQSEANIQVTLLEGLKWCAWLGWRWWMV